MNPGSNMKSQSKFKLFMMDAFPDFNVPDFDEKAYNARFDNSNVIIRARTKEVFYPDHWTCLSVKSAFQGDENYQGRNSFYTVNDNHFLVLNEGTVYKSFIHAPREVESFTINFSNDFARSVVNSSILSTEKMLDSPGNHPCVSPRFTERLYPHRGAISDLLFRIKKLSPAWELNHLRIEELYVELLESLMVQEDSIRAEIQQVRAVRMSTKKELYVRLHRAKDYMDSCFSRDLTVGVIAEVACLNEHYFLRQFKSMFQCTPYRYLQEKRLQAAVSLLRKSNHSVTEICGEVGYSDLASFSKLFKKRFDQSPMDCRRS